MPKLAAAFTAAIATRDRGRFAALLADDVDFRALTPGRTWEAHSPGDVTTIVFDNWFEEHDHIVDARMEPVVTIVDTQRMTYHFDLETPDGEHEVEQTGYYRSTAGRITWIRVVCSGFRPAVGA